MFKPAKSIACIMIFFLAFSLVFAGKAARCHARQADEKRVCTDQSCPMHKEHQSGVAEQGPEGVHSSHHKGDHSGQAADIHASHHGRHNSANDEASSKTGGVEAKKDCSTTIGCEHHKKAPAAEADPDQGLIPVCPSEIRLSAGKSMPVFERFQSNFELLPSERPPSV